VFGILFVYFCLLFCFKLRSPYVAQAVLELAILLPQPPSMLELQECNTIPGLKGLVWSKEDSLVPIVFGAWGAQWIMWSGVQVLQNEFIFLSLLFSGSSLDFEACVLIVFLSGSVGSWRKGSLFIHNILEKTERLSHPKKVQRPFSFLL
jgi:hypothetical protein